MPFLNLAMNKMMQRCQIDLEFMTIAEEVQEEFSRAQPSSGWQDVQDRMDDSWNQRRERSRSPRSDHRNAQRQKWRWGQLVKSMRQEDVRVWHLCQNCHHSRLQMRTT